ncbi:MAG: hypothetical protein ACHQX1_00940 [Candidatus Micrarchaeales archaeon]
MAGKRTSNSTANFAMSGRNLILVIIAFVTVFYIIANQALVITNLQSLSLYIYDLTHSSKASEVIYQVPITLYNNQVNSSYSGQAFQQMVIINSSDYLSYEASNLDNIEFFYPNGTVIYSWLEGNVNYLSSSSSLNSSRNHNIYWLRLVHVPEPKAPMLIYMGFAPKTTNLFDGVRVGEAPQLSSTYAQYDNGAEVFNFYDNFAGKALNLQWTASSTAYNVDDGLSLISGSTSNHAYISSGVLFGPYNTIDTLGRIYDTLSIGGAYIGIVNNTNSNAGSLITALESGGGTACANDNDRDLIKTTIATANTFGVWTISVLPGSANCYLNYSNKVSVNVEQGPLPQPLTYSTYGSPLPELYSQWIRVRTTPPNDTMPSVRIGNIH